jgi:hypothetical protein
MTFPFLLDDKSRLRKSDLKFLEIDGTVARRAGGCFGRGGGEIFYLGEDVTGCVHIDTVSIVSNQYKIKNTKKRLTDQYTPRQF